MTAVRLLGREDVEVWHADWRELLDALPRRDDGTVADTLIVDAPYSERTHSGHDGGERYDGSCVERGDGLYGHRKVTRGINYSPWSEGDVREFVDAHTPAISGWIVSITDHVLAPIWSESMERHGRYVFAPLPLVEIGSRVRLVGDGPSSWTCWLVVARPRSGAWLAQRHATRQARGAKSTLVGAYVYTGKGDREVMGGKTSRAMRALVRDYSEPGDVILDPCCGGGTTLVAAIREGRRAIGGDVMEEHAQMSAERCGRPQQMPLMGGAM